MKQKILKKEKASFQDIFDIFEGLENRRQGEWEKNVASYCVCNVSISRPETKFKQHFHPLWSF